MSQHAVATSSDRFEVVRLSLAAPGVSSDWTYTVPANTVLEILSAKSLLITDATAVTRYPSLAYYDPGGLQFLQIPDIIGQAAGALRIYNWAAGVGYQHQAAAGLSILTGIPTGILLSPGFIFRVITLNLAATDSWSTTELLCRRWIIE